MERQQSIDLLKIIAMFGVVALHATMQYITPGETGLADLVYDLGVISVPIFFMVSGFFLIPSKGSPKYCLKKVLGYIRFIASIVIIGWIGYSAAFGFDIATLGKWLLGTFLTHGPFGVFWYLWAIAICLILTPLINKIYVSHQKTYSILLLLLWVGCNFIFTHTLQGGLFERQIPALMKMYTWIFFYMLGGLMNRIDLKVPLFIPLTLLALSILFMEIFGKPINNEYASAFYLSIPVTTLCATLFLYFKTLKTKESKTIGQLSQIFLPVYAVHNVIIEFMPRFYDGLYLAPLINWIVVCTVSVLFGLAINRIPYINKLFKI